MDIFSDSTNNDGADFIYFPIMTLGTSVSVTTTCGTTFVIDDKDWMPYAFFEYDPIWHKKFASIKYQMNKMWD